MALKVTLAKVVDAALKAFLDTAKKKDKSNAGMLFAEWFFWKELCKLAGNREEVLRQRMIGEEIIKNPASIEDAGIHDIGECPAFVSTCKVTEKVKTFTPAAVADTLFASHKVPRPIVLQAIEAAKLPTGNPRRTIEIIER